MGSIKKTIEYENVLQQLLDKITFQPSDEDFNTQMLTIDIEALQESLKVLKVKEKGCYVDPLEFSSHLSVALNFLAMISEELSTKGTALLIDHRYIKKNQKQQRPKRKLSIPE